MFKRNLKLTLRSLLKQKEYTFINVIGLAIGMACCLLITLFVLEESNYDNFHADGDRIHRLALERMYPDHSTYYAVVPHSFTDVIQSDFPEVESTCRLVTNNISIIVRYENDLGGKDIYEESKFIFADSNFFDFFSIQLIQGDKKEVLLKPNSLVITKNIATKYFGDEDAIGKELDTDFGMYTITGVSENVPENSHFKYDFIGSLSTNQFFRAVNFISFSAYSYIKLTPEGDAKTLESKFPDMVENYAAAQVEERLEISFQDYTAAGNGYRYFLQPLEDIHLKSHLEAEIEANGDINSVYVFTSIAIFILLIASINFMNLSTARSTERAKEVGVRKVMGSSKNQLVLQFLSESFVISILSMVLALGIVQVILPYFNEIFDKSISMDLIAQPALLISILAFTLFVGFIAGIYPAFVISSFKPVTALKGKLIRNAKGIWLRNSLVIFQFFISIVLIAGILVVYNQMKFMQNKNLGFDKEHIMIIERAGALGDKWETFTNELLKIPNIKQVGQTSAMPGSESRFFFGMQFQPKGQSEVLTTKTMIIDDQFISTLGLEIIEGRGLLEATDDSLSVILNESAARTLGIDDPVGSQLINKLNNPTPEGETDVVFTIVGIIKDFNFQSLRDEISPFVLMNPGKDNPVNRFIAVKFDPQDLFATINEVEAKWTTLTENDPFKYSFLEDNLVENYKAEQNSGKIMTAFTSLAILIACVGLYGLAAFISQQRTKEIGIRKALGASIFNVLVLLSLDFTKLVVIAFFISIPIAWYFINQWLQGFAYSIELSIWYFIIAGFAALIIALMTISYQALKAAMVNPINSLKYE